MTLEPSAPPTRPARGIASAGAWSVGGKLVSRLFDLATLVILTAILTPADFGLVAKAMAVVMLVEMVTLLPIETPILRVKSPGRSLYDTAFTITLIRALLIGGLLVALSGPIAVYFKDPRLTTLICVLALAPALRGCLSPKMAELTRVYDMRFEAAMDIASKVASLIVVTAVALATGSYWAIAVGTIVTTLVLNVMSYVFAPYRPRLTLTDWPAFRDIATWVTLSQSIQAMSWQLDNFILGRMLGNDAFGRYAIARQLSDIPYQAIAMPLTRPMVASFSAAAEDTARQRQLWLRFSNGMLFAVGPIFVSLAALAPDVVFVLLGTGWDGAGLLLAGLAVTSLAALPAVPLNPFAAASFRTRLIALRILVQFLLSIPLLILGAYLAGALGVIVAKGLVNLAMLAFVITVLRDRIGLPVGQQIRAYWRSVLSLAFLGVLLYAVGGAFAEMSDGNRLLTALRLLVIALPCIGAYLVLCIGLWRFTGQPEGAEEFLWRKITPRFRRAPA